MGGIRWWAAIVAMVLFGAACGGSDDDVVESGDVAEAAVDDSASEEGDTDAATPAPDCDATSGLFTTADGATTLNPTSALAARILEGQAYTIYLADRPLAADEVSFINAPAAGAGETIVTVALTTFNAEEPPLPVVAGEVVEYTPDFGVRTFVVTADIAGELLGNSTDASGTLTVTEVDGRFCAVVSYEDAEKSIEVVIDAEIVDI